MFTDPTGMNYHDYKKNQETGRLELVKETNDDFDRIIASDNSELIVDKGVIKDENRGIKITGFDQNGNKRTIEYDFYQFDNKDKAYEFYEFMTNKKTNWVEFSLNDYTSSNGKNFFHIGTIGEQTHEAAWSLLFDKEYRNDNGIKLNVARHYHPYTAGASPADDRAKELFFTRYPNQNTKFLIDCYECEFNKETNKAVPKSVIPY